MPLPILFTFGRKVYSPLLVGLVLISMAREGPVMAEDPSQQASPNQSSDAGERSHQTQGVVSTGGSHAAVLDEKKRPITAGGFVDAGPVIFQDIAEKAGLTGWRHVTGTPQKTFILETVGSGVGLIDHDNDAWLDIYLVNGSTYEAMAGKAQSPHAALFHNNHDGTFTDVAPESRSHQRPLGIRRCGG
jgi:enediyne biosynthesis protein E4